MFGHGKLAKMIQSLSDAASASANSRSSQFEKLTQIKPQVEVIGLVFYERVKFLYKQTLLPSQVSLLVIFLIGSTRHKKSYFPAFILNLFTF